MIYPTDSAIHPLNNWDLVLIMVCLKGLKELMRNNVIRSTSKKRRGREACARVVEKKGQELGSLRG